MPLRGRCFASLRRDQSAAWGPELARRENMYRCTWWEATTGVNKAVRKVSTERGVHACPAGGSELAKSPGRRCRSGAWTDKSSIPTSEKAIPLCGLHQLAQVPCRCGYALRIATKLQSSIYTFPGAIAPSSGALLSVNSTQSSRACERMSSRTNGDRPLRLVSEAVRERETFK